MHRVDRWQTLAEGMGSWSFGTCATSWPPPKKEVLLKRLECVLTSAHSVLAEQSVIGTTQYRPDTNNGSEFISSSQHLANPLARGEGIDVAWVEEAANISHAIRKIEGVR
jgi:transposase